jgi:hypothetical protein
MIRAERDLSLRARIVSSASLPFVRAGSALVWCDGRLLVVQDDALAVAWVEPESMRIEHVALAGFGGRLEKALKPDFEAAFTLSHGAIVILGSGSTQARCRAAKIDVATGAVDAIDCAPMFEALAVRLGVRPNIEGAVLDGAVLRLFHRGAGGAPSAVAELPLSALDARGAIAFDLVACDLGARAGVPLTFTDAAPCEGGAVYLAVAEDTPNAVDDGPVVGAAVGVFHGSSLRFCFLEDESGAPTTKKVEGIAGNPKTGEIFMITDPDDPDSPVELCRVRLEGFPALRGESQPA